MGLTSSMDPPTFWEPGQRFLGALIRQVLEAGVKVSVGVSGVLKQQNIE